MHTGERPLHEIVELVLGHLRDELSRGASEFPKLAALEESVHLENDHGVVVYGNPTHRRLFSPQQSPIGRSCEAYLDPVLSATMAKLNEIVLDGCPFVECEHTGPGPDGSAYHLRTHVRSLYTLGAPGYALLGVSRLIRREEGEGLAARVDLATSCARFRELAERDQDICRLTALGVNSRELGERLGMTTRGIELRKQKAFARLGVAKAVDLARLLTRLQDRGFLDLGL